MTVIRLNSQTQPASEASMDVAGQDSAAVSVARLTLNDYRNYHHLRLDLDPGPVVLTGPNGAGKTNLLEALSFLAPGRGLRNAKLANVGRLQGDIGLPWAVATHLARPKGACEIGTGLDHAEPGGEGRRVTRIDGAVVRGQAPLAEELGVLWLTPTMDRLFSEGPASRRRFLDRLVSGLEPGHARQLAAYERGVRERSRLLAERADAGWITAVEETLAAHAVAVAAARRESIARLSAALARQTGPFPRAALSLDGAVEGWLDEMPAVDVEARLCEALVNNRRHDAESGGAAQGPHRSDLVVINLDKDIPAALCSTGEQKALLIAIVIANARLHTARRGETPLLLLDEVVAHLDPDRRAALLEAVLALGAQAWFTGTEPALFDAITARAQFLTIRDGSAEIVAGTARS
jgi:DNA replication and repair protein RecF